MAAIGCDMSTRNLEKSSSQFISISKYNLQYKARLFTSAVAFNKNGPRFDKVGKDFVTCYHACNM